MPRATNKAKAERLIRVPEMLKLLGCSEMTFYRSKRDELIRLGLIIKQRRSGIGDRSRSVWTAYESDIRAYVKRKARRMETL